MFLAKTQVRETSLEEHAMKKLIGLRPWRRAGVTMSAGLVLTAVVGLGGFSELSEAQTARKSQVIYRNSFSKPEIFVNNVIPDSMKGKKDTVEVPSLNSFPLRIQVDGIDVNDWKQPAMASEPKKVNKVYKVANCQFDIVSSDFSVRKYGGDSPGQLLVTADALMPQSTFAVDKEEQLLFSLTASLSVTVEEKFVAACKESFAGRNFSIGRVSFSGSQLYGVGLKGDAVNATVYRPESAPKLYVTWNQETNRLSLLDQIGMVPEIETDVYALSFSEKEAYYLGFDASFKIIRDKQKVAKK
jgi:hypothetical protein